MEVFWRYVGGVLEVFYEPPKVCGSFVKTPQGKQRGERRGGGPGLTRLKRRF